jgi:S1-C subfamily serine protease
MAIEINIGSIKSLFIKMRFSERLLSTGTGFIIMSKNGPVLVTNRHNVTGKHQTTGECLDKYAAIPDEIVITHNSAEGVGVWINVVEPLYKDGVPLWMEHPSLGKLADFVALPLTQFEGVNLWPYEFNESPGTTIRVGVADIVSVIGFPFGLTAGKNFAIWSTGFVASEPNSDFKELPVFLIDCRSRPGQSGSAVMAVRNGGLIPMNDGNQISTNVPITTFMGIYSGRIHNESDLGMVWKASAIKELIDSIQAEDLSD